LENVVMAKALLGAGVACLMKGFHGINEYSIFMSSMDTATFAAPLDLGLLRLFSQLAEHQHLPSAAAALHLTPSAVSKGLRRLESSLQTPLFDRRGRRLLLNAAGTRLRERAAPLLAHADQLQAEFLGERGAFRCQLAGPALLQLQWGRRIAAALGARFPAAQVSFGSEPEDQALAALVRGEADLALVTREALPAPDTRDTRLAVLDVGTTRFQVAIGERHPLAKRRRGGGFRAAVKDVLRCDFVAATRPPFRGLAGAPATDGWRDDVLPRRVRYRSDDLVMVDGLVRAGLALAYLPEFAIAELGLSRLEVLDCPYHCEQQVVMVYRPSAAAGWMSTVVAAVERR
jgi:DNA-binding transcriptional LysR family regulator